MFIANSHCTRLGMRVGRSEVGRKRALLRQIRKIAIHLHRSRSNTIAQLW